MRRLAWVDSFPIIALVVVTLACALAALVGVVRIVMRKAEVD